MGKKGTSIVTIIYKTGDGSCLGLITFCLKIHHATTFTCDVTFVTMKGLKDTLTNQILLVKSEPSKQSSSHT